jgi:membrane protein implicated in regulation of membrane protease activity
MDTWIIWWILAGGLVILEIFSGTFYLLMLAIGLAVGGIAGWLGWGLSGQLVAASVCGISATLLLRRSKIGRPQRSDAARDPNVNIDIGQTLHVDSWNTLIGEAPAARVMYRGAMWDIRLAPDTPALPGSFVISEIRGSHLIVKQAH